ncbi:MAG: hypothetical protein ACYC7E_14570 [Armatimonadota bacterium]
MRMWFRLGVLLGALALLGAAWAAKPAILFFSPQGAAYGYVDLDYLKELHQAGFEVDYTDNLTLDWERLKRYNVVVLYYTPDAMDVVHRAQKPSPQKIESFVTLIERYLEESGGVFLFAPENNMVKQALGDLTDRWGAKLPVENIIEQDKEKMGVLSHSSQGTEIAFTDNILPSPVTKGVTQIWYPCRPAYNGGMSGPILVDNNWQVVVKASRTSVTKPVDTSKSTARMPVEIKRDPPVAAPDLMAIRSLKNGRVALINQWQQFSIGSGTRWIYNREVLDRGVKGKPSHFGALLQNTFRWLAEPSLTTQKVGGFVTNPERLLPGNLRDDVKKQYADKIPPYDPAKLGTVTLPAQWKLYRGLIGAKTAYSSGVGTVEQYAIAARQAKLDFLVFLEDFDKLTPAKFEALKADCVRLSDDNLLLLAGFNVRSNIDDHMFFYSRDPEWPPDLVLTGPNKSRVYLAEEKDGGFTGFLTPFLDYILRAYHVERGQVGYYDFGTPGAQRLMDCRLYAATAVRYYRDGKLVQDITQDYLTTALATIPPAPMSVNEVTSPVAMVREIQLGHALTYGRASSLKRDDNWSSLFLGALRWSHQYDSMPVFSSDGPLIHEWYGCHRVWTYGAEDFVTGKAVMYSPIKVTAEKGLKSIAIYNGPVLYRRFLCNGMKEYMQTLVLDGNVQKNLVLIAEDMAGGKAVSFARRCWKDGGMAPSFCSDHVNDGGYTSLAHGPYMLQFNHLPPISYNRAGDTWDGGPTGVFPLTGHQQTTPVLQVGGVQEDAYRMNQTPMLETSDDGLLAVRQEREQFFDTRVQRVVNPWHTYGPLGEMAKNFTHTAQLHHFVPRTVDVPHVGWAAVGMRQGVNASVYTGTMRFKQPVAAQMIGLGFIVLKGEGTVVISDAAGMHEVDFKETKQPTFDLRRGDWFALYPKVMGNPVLYVNRGEPIRLMVRTYLWFYALPLERNFAKDERHVFEMTTIGFQVEGTPISKADEFLPYVNYLQEPAGVTLSRGTRVPGPGLYEVKPAQGAVEITATQAGAPTEMLLPVCVRGLNPRWSAGLYQVAGYSKGFHGTGDNRYRALGMDFAGDAWFSLYTSAAPRTHVIAGHPVIAGPEGADLFIQVTKVADEPARWHVSVNNPTDKPITTTLRKAIALPGFDFPNKPITLRPGEYVVLQ